MAIVIDVRDFNGRKRGPILLGGYLLLELDMAHVGSRPSGSNLSVDERQYFVW
jgi:hypothetical protein